MYFEDNSYGMCGQDPLVASRQSHSEVQHFLNTSTFVDWPKYGPIEHDKAFDLPSPGS